MNIQRFARDGGHLAERYEYEDRTVVAVDFGPAGVDGAVDVVDDTVMIVTGGEQYELEVPREAGDPRAFMKNGVLTIEMEEDV